MQVERLCWLDAQGQLALSFDGRGPDGNGVRNAEVIALFDVASARTAGHLFGHAPNNEGYVTHLGALASGGMSLPHSLASACSDGVVKVWDVRTRRPTHSLVDKAQGEASAITFAPVGDMPLLFSGSSDGAIRLWDLRNSGRCVYELATGNARVEALEWDAAGCALLALTRRDAARRAYGRDSDDDDAEGEAWDAWPRDAHHSADDFGVQWDQPHEEYGFAQYRFTEEPQQPDRFYGPHSERPATWRYVSEAYPPHAVRTIMS